MAPKKHALPQSSFELASHGHQPTGSIVDLQSVVFTSEVKPSETRAFGRQDSPELAAGCSTGAGVVTAAGGRLVAASFLRLMLARFSPELEVHLPESAGARSRCPLPGSQSSQNSAQGTSAVPRLDLSAAVADTCFCFRICSGPRHGRWPGALALGGSMTLTLSGWFQADSFPNAQAGRCRTHDMGQLNCGRPSCL